MKNFTPNPIDTSGITIPKELTELIEKLAENNHDNWAKQRIEEGWSLGKTRNDNKREHPCIIPYSELPEIEKQYDRTTVTEALKAIIHYGFQIKSPQ